MDHFLDGEPPGGILRSRLPMISARNGPGFPFRRKFAVPATGGRDRCHVCGPAGAGFGQRDPVGRVEVNTRAWPLRGSVNSSVRAIRCIGVV